MRIVCLSDTHETHDQIQVPAGDLLLFAGDLTNRGSLAAIADFNRWLGTLPHRHKVIICGNHDVSFEKTPAAARQLITHAVYLEDTSVVVEGLTIHGSPWQPWFYNWAFNLRRGSQLAAKWSLIPDQADIVVTHGPAFGIHDLTYRGEHVGCEDLLKRLDTIRPKLHLCGHIHEGAGAAIRGETLFVNASVYEGSGRPVVIDTDGGNWRVVSEES